MRRRDVLATGAAAGLLPGLAAAKTVAVEVPIRSGYGIPWTGCWIDRKGPFGFALVSGSNTFGIQTHVAQELGLPMKPGGRGRSANHFGEVGVGNSYIAKEFLIGGAVALTDVELWAAATYSAAARPPAGANAGSIVGRIPLMPDRITTFEFGRGVMRYLPTPPADLASYIRLPVKLTSVDRAQAWRPQIEGTLGGKPIRLGIDIGSTEPVTLYPDAAKRLGFWTVDAPAYKRKVEVVNYPTEVRILRGPELQLGALKIASPLLRVQDPNFSLRDPNQGADGVIGMEVLRRMDLILNSLDQSIWVRPTKAFHDPARYDRAGFDLQNVAGDWVLGRVDPGSPAARAGLAEGDVLAGGGEMASRLRSGQLGMPGDQIVVEVVRKGQPKTVTVELEDRL